MQSDLAGRDNILIDHIKGTIYLFDFKYRKLEVNTKYHNV